MSEEKEVSNFWYVEFPTYQYKEDVKALAKKAGLVVVDAAYQGDNENPENAPELTKKNSDSQASDEPKEGTKDWLKLQLDGLETEYPADAKKDELQVLLDEALEAE